VPGSISNKNNYNNNNKRSKNKRRAGEREGQKYIAIKSSSPHRGLIVEIKNPEVL